jgi:hypothetical protein
MNGAAPNRKRSRNSSARSSLQQGVTNLIRTLSLSKRGGSTPAQHQQAFSSEKPLAIPATPYQVYGPEIWSRKAKKMQRGAQGSRERRKTVDLAGAYQSGQSQFVGVIEGAKRKLTWKTSQKRRKQLKDSIVVVGRAQTRNKKLANGPSIEDEAAWI